MLAASNGHTEAVTLLLCKGADLEAKAEARRCKFTHTLASIICLPACESSQDGTTAFDLAPNDEIRALLRAARPAALAPAPPSRVARPNAQSTPILVPSDVAYLLSRLSLSSYGPALVDKFGLTLSNAHLLQEKDLTGLGMKPLQARALLHAVAPPPLPAPPPPTVAAELQRCDSAAIVRLLRSLGYLSATADTAAALRDELSAELVATSAPNLAAALEAAVAARLASFIELQAVPRLTVAGALLQWAGRFDAMWLELYAKYVPFSLPPDKPRSEKRVLIIGPGFGLNSSNAAAELKGILLERAGFTLHPVWASDPERPGYEFAKGVNQCLEALSFVTPPGLPGFAFGELDFYVDRLSDLLLIAAQNVGDEQRSTVFTRIENISPDALEGKFRSMGAPDELILKAKDWK